MIKVTFYVQLKRKPEQEDKEAAESSERSTSQGCAEAVTSPLQTPVSGKGGRSYGRCKATKCDKSGWHTPISYSRKDSPFQLCLLFYVHT